MSSPMPNHYIILIQHLLRSCHQFIV